MSERLRDLAADKRFRIGAGIALAWFALYWVPGSPLPDKMPWGVVTQGVIFGTSYALQAMGLILIYRTTRIVNFGYAAMGAMPGALAVGLFLEHGVPWFAAIALSVAWGVIIGGLVDVLVIRRFANASRLVLTVATIGLGQILAAMAMFTTVALGSRPLIGNIETPLDSSFFVRPYPVRGDHILMLAVAPLAIAGLGWFLLRTSAGMAVRGAAENQDRALLLGIPVRRLQTIVWAVAGGLSTITYVTKAPFTGVIPDAIAGQTAILPGLAAAVIARFKSLPVAMAGGLVLGLAEWTIRWNVRAESIFDVTFLVVILVALLVQKNKASRAETGDSGWDAAAVVRPVPKALRSLPEVRGARWALAAVLAAVLVFVPLAASPSSVVLMSFGVVWAMVAVSLVLLTGWGGSISLGQFAIVGIGAMVAGNLLERWNVDLFVALAASVVAGGLIAVVIGVPALRIRGLYLAVTTLAFAVALDSYFLNPVNFSSFVPDRVLRPVVWKRFELDSEHATYFVCLFALLAVIAVTRALRRSRAGRVVLGTRDNDRAAAALGVPITRVKLQTFLVAGCVAGLAGGLYVVVLAGVGQNTFRPEMSFAVFSFAVIGGLGSVAGAITGVAFFRGLDWWLADTFSGSTVAILRLSLTGTGLLVILYFLPGGLWQLVQRWRDRLLRVVAKRRDIEVPTLTADKREAEEEASDADSTGPIEMEIPTEAPVLVGGRP
ncbi:MAG TPA: ABC transporter permease [Acidimicrobiales bacterium]|nr:ABC transporter permease [Acidimicrobiales bacterium]